VTTNREGVYPSYYPHASNPQLNIETQENYLILGVDANHGAAVQEELQGLLAHTPTRGEHQHSLSILHDKECEETISL
jgi:hypothetical protein